MLASWVTEDSPVTTVYIEVITDIECQVHLLYLEVCFIQERHEHNCGHLC